MPGAARAGSKRHPYRRRRNRYGRGRAQVNGTPVLGAIDVGTNACRLLIAVPEHDASRGQMLVPRVIDSFTANVRLGESLERTGTITVAALDRTIAALKECAKRLKKRRVTHVKAIATEACRKAKNAQDLVTRAEEEAGIHLCIVTPEEEARLAAAGCVQLIGAEFDGALIFDIGGGSTELILVKRTAVNGSPIRHDILAWSSAPVGVVKLAERHGGRELRASSYPAMNAELLEMFSAMKSELEPDVFDAKRFHLLGTSGTLDDARRHQARLETLRAKPHRRPVARSRRHRQDQRHDREPGLQGPRGDPLHRHGPRRSHPSRLRDPARDHGQLALRHACASPTAACGKAC